MNISGVTAAGAVSLYTGVSVQARKPDGNPITPGGLAALHPADRGLDGPADGQQAVVAQDAQLGVTDRGGSEDDPPA